MIWYLLQRQYRPRRVLMETAMPRPLLSFARITDKAGAAKTVWRLIEDDCGVTAIEYALIVGLIVMAFVALITQIGDFISVPLDTVASYL